VAAIVSNSVEVFIVEKDTAAGGGNKSKARRGL
jgi:hypothetical protein